MMAPLSSRQTHQRLGGHVQRKTPHAGGRYDDRIVESHQSSHLLHHQYLALQVLIKHIWKKHARLLAQVKDLTNDQFLLTQRGKDHINGSS